MTTRMALKVWNAITPGAYRVTPLRPRVPEDRRAHGLKGAFSGAEQVTLHEGRHCRAEARFCASQDASFEQRARVILDFELPTLTSSAGYSRSWLFSSRDSMLTVLRLVPKATANLLKREMVTAIAQSRPRNLLLDVELTDRMAVQVKQSSSLVADESLRRHLPAPVDTL